jgi:hypothetical protein
MGISFFALCSLRGAGLSRYAVGHRFARELHVTGLLLRVKFTTDAMLHPVSRNGNHTVRSLLFVGFMEDRVVDIWPELFRSKRAEI